MGHMSIFINNSNSIENNRMFLEKLKVSLVKNEENVVKTMSVRGINKIDKKEFEEIAIMASNYGRVNSLILFIENREDIALFQNLLKNLFLESFQKSRESVCLSISKKLEPSYFKQCINELSTEGYDVSLFSKNRQKV